MSTPRKPSMEEAIDHVKAHEATPTDATVEITLEDLAAMRAQSEELASLRRTLTDMQAKSTLQEDQLRRAKIERECVPTIIGGPTGVHPADLDIIVGFTPNQLIANLTALFGRSDTRMPTGIALVPVRLFPAALQPKDRPYVCDRAGHPRTDRDTGAPIRNFLVGQSQFQESYATAHILVDGAPLTVALSGMAILNVNPFGGLDPTALHARLEKRLDPDHPRLSQTRTRSPSVDADPYGPEGPPFIPSHQTLPTQRNESTDRAHRAATARGYRSAADALGPEDPDLG